MGWRPWRRWSGRSAAEPADMRPGDEAVYGGIDFRLGAQLDLLEEFRGAGYQRLFDLLRSDDRINPGFAGVDYRPRGLIHNGYFPSPDAELYGAMILRTRPRRIVEVGSGFSTLVARAAIRHAGLDTRLIAIDPEPRRPVQDVADQVERVPVQESSLLTESVPEGTLLFIDSSHRIDPDGDGPFLYERLLPSLGPGVLVHVHDVFLPFEYPRHYLRLDYREQYGLHALLSGRPDYRVIFAAHLALRRHPAEAARAFGEGVVSDPLFGGASFWFHSGGPGVAPGEREAPESSE